MQDDLQLAAWMRVWAEGGGRELMRDGLLLAADRLEARAAALKEARQWAIFAFDNFEFDWQWTQLHPIGKDYAAWLAANGVVIDDTGRRVGDDG